jgi:biotin transport system substrate-specific component
MTMQTLVVLLIGATYGWRLGGATVLLYLAEGMFGLPVFANTPPAVASPAYLLGPTGGYLIGYVAAAVVMGFLAERGWDRSLLRVVVMMTLGHLIIFAFGLAWLAHLFGPAKAWVVGAAPFVTGTVLKTALAAALMKAAWTIVRR